MDTRYAASMVFRQLLSVVDPQWNRRPAEEQEELVAWYTRTARAIARHFALSFRDPCHDAADVLQDILLKLFEKFHVDGAPHRLLTERPCIRNLMEWKGLDRVDWENASRRSARRRAALPDEDMGLTDKRHPSPDRNAELRDEERAFRCGIDDPEDREAYRLFRNGRRREDVARALGRNMQETRAIEDRLRRRLSAAIGAHA